MVQVVIGLPGEDIIVVPTLAEPWEAITVVTELLGKGVITV